jgi:predicted transcriptional regulator
MIITGFQLRASRKALNLTLDELSNNANVSKVTLARLINTPLSLGFSTLFLLH